MSAPVDVLAVMDTACRLHEKGAYGDAWEVELSAVYEARAAVAQFQRDVQTSLSMLTADGLADAPVAGFLRAALARVQGGAA